MRHAPHLSRLGSLTAASLATCLVVTAMAEPPDRPPPPHPDPLRRALDTNGDHELDADEISKAAEALATLDADQDGRITRDELFPRPPAGGPGRGPGDLDGDRPGPRGELGGPPPERGPGAPPREGEGFRPPPGPDPERFGERAMSFDADGDGKLDRAELGKLAEEMRSRMRPRDPERFRRGPPPRPGRGDGDAGPERPRRPFGEEERPAPPPDGDRDES